MSLLRFFKCWKTGPAYYEDIDSTIFSPTSQLAIIQICDSEGIPKHLVYDRTWCTGLHTYFLNMALLESKLQHYYCWHCGMYSTFILKQIINILVAHAICTGFPGSHGCDILYEWVEMIIMFLLLWIEVE